MSGDRLCRCLRQGCPGCNGMTGDVGRRVTAPVPSPVWPDDATIATASGAAIKVIVTEHGEQAFLGFAATRRFITAALSSVDPGEAVRLLAQVREIVGIARTEHPCAGSCQGCGAGPDEACVPPCRCDEGEDCAAATAIEHEEAVALRRLAALLAGGGT